jgi:uncharacterized membrane-anchored protein YhcB (DUF1043 family)
MSDQNTFSIINWLVTGIVSVTGSVITAWITHVFTKRRERRKWEMEAEERKRQHELEQTERVKERIREDLTKFVHDPQTIQTLSEQYRRMFRMLPKSENTIQIIRMLDALVELIVIHFSSSPENEKNYRKGT